MTKKDRKSTKLFQYGPRFEIASKEFIFAVRLISGFVFGVVLGFALVFRAGIGGIWMDPNNWTFSNIAIMGVIGSVFGVLAVNA